MRTPQHPVDATSDCLRATQALETLILLCGDDSMVARDCSAADLSPLLELVSAGLTARLEGLRQSLDHHLTQLDARLKATSLA